MPDTTTARTDSVLVSLIAQGDAAAFSELYVRMRPRVLGLARRVLYDSGHAEEVTQEVFLEIWQSASRFDGSKGSATGWILRTAHGRAVDRVRSAQARRLRENRIGMRDWADTREDIAEVVSLRVDSGRMQRALLTLPDAQREAVALAHLGGYSHTQVSAILKVPVGTVKTRIRAGMGRLREQLAAA